jgi:hypothetical protein
VIRRGHILAVALVLLSNALALVHVARDRQGAPETAVWLSEREMPLMAPERESSFLSLQLVWTGEDREVQKVFDEPVLRALGFDCSVPPGDRRARDAYRRQTARAAWIAFELDGPAWSAWQQREREEFERRAAARPVAANDAGPSGTRPADAQPADDTRPNETREAFEQRLRTSSRLVPVAAGPDAAALRRRYPDRERVLIVPAHVNLWASVEDPVRERKARLVALPWMEVRDVAVPLALRAPLAGLSGLRCVPGSPCAVRAFGTADADKPLPHYRVRLVIGRDFLPRLDAIERAATPPASS